MCLYLIYDVENMMGGGHHMNLTPDDYIIGALTVYLDIFYLFITLICKIRQCC